MADLSSKIAAALASADSSASAPVAPAAPTPAVRAAKPKRTSRASAAPPPPPPAPAAGAGAGAGAAPAAPALPAAVKKPAVVRDAARRAKARRRTIGGTPGTDRLYEAAKKREARIAAAAKQLPAEYTFAPKTNTSKAAAATTDGSGPRYNRLYADAQKRAARRKEKAQAKDSEYSFSPSINKRPTRATGATTGTARFERLYADAAKRQEHRQTKLNAKETFSFSPEITKKAKQSRSSGPRSQRLYEQGVSSAAKLAAQRAAAEEASKPSFRPHINKRPVSGGNFSKRLAAYEAARAQRRAEAQQARTQQERAELTFKPSMSKRSKELAKGRANEKPIHERLYSDTKVRDAKRQAARNAAREQEGLTFQPKVSRSKSAVRSATTNPAERTEIWQRLYADRARKAEEQKRLAQEKAAHELEECTFKPTVTKRKGDTAGAAAAAGTDSVFARLYKDTDQARVQAQLRDTMRAEAEMEECTFQPKISHRSKSVTRPRKGKTIWDDLHNQAKDTARLERLAAEAELAECTFQPKISKSGRRKSSNRPAWKRLSDQSRADVMRARAEEKTRLELAECTFQPSVNSSYQPSRTRDAKPIYERLAETGTAARPATAAPRSRAPVRARGGAAGSGAGASNDAAQQP